MLLGAAAIRGQDLPAEPPVSGRPSAPPASTLAWREAPEYVALFAPRLYRDAYRAFVSAAPLDAALGAVARDAGSLQPPGAWVAHPQLPFDAFGAGGTYDRWKVARLYGSRRVQVARGPRGRNGLVEESWFLLSPYPSPGLDRLEPGTLLLILRIP